MNAPSRVRRTCGVARSGHPPIIAAASLPLPVAPAPIAEPSPLPTRPVVLYDGVCGLCARSVRFILDHEGDHELVFAPLQGDTAAALRVAYPTIPTTVATVVLVEGGRAYLRSKAFFHLSAHLRSPWRWLHALRWFPGFLADLGYRFIAAIRYKIWGTVDACQLPSPENRARFLP